jgi:hypothetical protein
VLWRILASLADLEESRGNEAAAGELLEQAHEVVDYIAEHAGELREMFLTSAEVQNVLLVD